MALTPEQVGDVANRLAGIFSDPRGAVIWLMAPHPLLDGDRAVDRDYDTIVGLIELIETGTFV